MAAALRDRARSQTGDTLDFGRSSDQRRPLTRTGGGLGVCWLATTSLAVRSIVRHDIPAHHRWMYRSYALTLAGVTLRIYSPSPWGSGSRMPTGWCPGSAGCRISCSWRPGCTAEQAATGLGADGYRYMEPEEVEDFSRLVGIFFLRG